ncbi:MLP-like protein 28 [Abrus precatorius]|uniref:MLP-like protein 28 n=1 Tax=Abrus precatorius TaxID=3816 RepID=A0A8B8JXF0_ABRPR|nr:MLP-like protein 28 [Abrus precatorius]
MALTGKVSTELKIHSPAAKFFNIFVEQLHHIQNITETVHETKLHEGEWHDVGSVKHWTYTVDGKVASCKESIEVIDAQNKSLTFNIYDGDVAKQYKILKAHLQVIDQGDGSAVAKWTYEFEKVNEDIKPPYAYLEFVTKVTKDVDDHLIKA